MDKVIVPIQSSFEVKRIGYDLSTLFRANWFFFNTPIFGHIHNSYGRIKIGGTTFINASNASPVRILLFNRTGKQVQTLVEQAAYKGGLNSLELETGDLAAGHYFVRMVANELAVVKRLVVVK